MAENTDSVEAVKKKRGGRPPGPSNKPPVDAVSLTLEEICSVLVKNGMSLTEPVEAVTKEPKRQGGNDGRVVGGRIYTPASWIGARTLCIRITEMQELELKHLDSEKKYAARKANQE